MSEPWQWAPSIFALQLFQIGSFDVVGLPGEYTTMAGRRIRNAVFNVTNHEVVLAGLSNNYINYIATPEEYDFEDYEGGATIYGRNTVPVTTTLFKEMAQKILAGEEDQIPDGPTPPSFLDQVREDIDPHADPPPKDGLNFGDVAVQAEASYKKGQEVRVVFAGGSPRNSPLRKGSFLTVEKWNEEMRVWVIFRTDADVDTL